MTTRLVGLPCGTAIETGLATATTPTNSGANGAPKRRCSTSTSGTISTTAPSSETTAVSPAHTAHTRA